jgi:hypothetical protein
MSCGGLGRLSGPERRVAVHYPAVLITHLEDELQVQHAHYRACGQQPNVLER